MRMTIRGVYCKILYDGIMDLGGDTSYNVIDLFLAADTGFVLTTCDPASYLDAYSFIKVKDLINQQARLEFRLVEKVL